MITLSSQDAKDVKLLIRKFCCNYCEGNCLLLDDGEPCICPQTITYSLCCKWFRKSVLPQNADLYIKLMRPYHTKKCVRCGKEYIYKSNRMKYCNSCKIIMTRRQTAQRTRKWRSNKK